MSDTIATPPRRITRETTYQSRNGYGTTAVAVLCICVGAAALARGLAPWPVGVAFLLVAGVLLTGLYMLQPNEAVILTLFGKYQGTDRTEGLRWRNPLQSGTKISLRARNLNTAPLKVNDKRGNPVEIGAAVVWRVHDTAQAVFDIDDYTRFVSVQAAPGWKCSTPSSRTWRMRRRSRTSCCAGSRPPPSSARATRSSPARWAWWRPP